LIFCNDLGVFHGMPWYYQLSDLRPLTLGGIELVCKGLPRPRPIRSPCYQLECISLEILRLENICLGAATI
jgi:hypothetical protein